MEKFTLDKAQGWVLISTASACRIQIVGAVTSGKIRLYAGSNPPPTSTPPAYTPEVVTDRGYFAGPTEIDTYPYFELPAGETFHKTDSDNNLYAYAPSGTVRHPVVVTVSSGMDAVGGTSSGGGGTTNGLTNTQLRATPVTVDPKVQLYTAGYSRVSTSSTIANVEKVTIANVGNADGTVMSVVLKPGESVTFDAPSRGTISTFPYNSTNTVFAIATITATYT